jgi:hypothetical protein
LAGQNENVDAQLKDFCATTFLATRTQEGVTAPREFYQEKNDESALDSYTSALT